MGKAVAWDLGPNWRRDDDEAMAILKAEAKDRGVGCITDNEIVRIGPLIVAWDKVRNRYVYLADA